MKAVLIRNPLAGKRAGEDKLEPALDVFSRAGWSVSVESTGGPGHATSIAREAVESGLDAVLVAGGDGTVNEVIQSLANSGVALGYIPYGTVNVWARELGIPQDPIQSATAAVNGRVELIDLGVANDRYFLLMAGVGFDGEVVRRAHPTSGQKHRLGSLAYAWTGVSTAILYRGSDMELRYDGVIRRVQALMLVIGNTRLYGGRFRLTPDAVANDGLLDVCIVRGKGPIGLARQSVPVLVSGSVGLSDVELLQVSSLSVDSEEPLSIQVDGEFVGTTPAEFRVSPGALKAIVPQEHTSDLISSKNAVDAAS